MLPIQNSPLSPAAQAVELLANAQKGNRHAALFDAARLLAQAGADAENATNFLMAGALAIGLSHNAATRRSIARGLARGRSGGAL